METVQISINKLHLGVLLGDFCTLVAVADQCGDLVFWVSFIDRIESVSTDVPYMDVQ